MKRFLIKPVGRERALNRAISPVPVRPLWRRLLWMVMLWSASVLALGVVATLFRLLMTAAGLKTH